MKKLLALLLISCIGCSQASNKPGLHYCITALGTLNFLTPSDNVKEEADGFAYGTGDGRTVHVNRAVCISITEDK